MRWILLALVMACSAPTTTPDAGDSHELRAATKALCEYRYDCLGLERDYEQCEADARACDPYVVNACIEGPWLTTDHDSTWCEAVGSCLVLECGDDD